MPIEKLRADLARLREEIAASEGGDPAALARLAELAAEVEAEIQQEAALGDRTAWVEEFEEAISGFEASHPTLASVMNSIVNALGSMGV